MSERIYVFKRFERFWHWSQATLLIFMMLTGFEVHGVHSLFGFKNAANYHTTAAWTLVGLWILAIFWHLTTGEWRQYIPTTDRLPLMVRYYAIGIFLHEPHPFKATRERKHNPLQRFTYLGLLLFVLPLLWISGMLYFFYNDWAALGLDGLQLAWVATAHTVGAFLLLAFLVAHLYIATTGHTPTAHLRAMITGWEEVG